VAVRARLGTLVIDRNDLKGVSMTATAMSTVPDSDGLSAASALQTLLPQLVALTLDAKHAHWNVTGPAFLPLHALTDEIAADTRVWVDRVAERAVALGYTVDARPAQVASAVTEQFPAGPLTDDEVIAELTGRIGAIAATARDSLVVLEQADPVAHGVTIDVIEGLEKYLWMLRAQRR
jgi:starvation-inducible DNA-binding protein